MDDDISSRAGMSISTLKCPLLAIMAPLRIASSWLRPIACNPPVAVMNTSPSLAASTAGITANPSMTASRARTGLVSVTITSEPMPRARAAMPRPHQPYPDTTTFRPAQRILVALVMPSSVLWPVP